MNKYVLVTGANGGIGKATVSKILENKCKAISIDIRDDNIKNLETHFVKYQDNGLKLPRPLKG